MLLVLQTPQDFILLELYGGFPILTIDHGTGPAVLHLDGKDQQGTQLMQALSDGAWHTIDINRDGKVRAAESNALPYLKHNFYLLV